MLSLGWLPSDGCFFGSRVSANSHQVPTVGKTTHAPLHPNAANALLPTTRQKMNAKETLHRLVGGRRPEGVSALAERHLAVSFSLTNPKERKDSCQGEASDSQVLSHRSF